MAHNLSLADHIRPIMGSIRTVPVPYHTSDAPAPAAPFITVSREPGSGARWMAGQLIDSLNAALPGEQSWSAWDRELVEKVAADHHLSTRLIESLEDRGHSWFGEFLESLTFSDSPQHADEAKVYRRVAQTIRALAQAGRVMIVGRGGVFITRHMPGGIHVRLVAPFEKRVEFMAREYELTKDKAIARVKELEHNRHAFYRRYWPNETLRPDLFTLTINTAEVAPATMIELVTSLVKSKVGAAQR